jgi:predicted RNase H-like HicB family nuclease
MKCIDNFFADLTEECEVERVTKFSWGEKSIFFSFVIYCGCMKSQKKKILEYAAVFQEEKSGGYSVWVPELPGCASQGETLDEAKEHIEEAISLYLEDASSDVFASSKDSGLQFFVPVRVAYG